MRLVFHSFAHRINQGQSPFRIGVANLHFFAAGGVHNRIRNHGVAVDFIGCSGQVGADLNILWLQLAEGLHGSQNDRAAGHVAFHGDHVIARFHLITAGIEDHALAHDGDVFFGFTGFGLVV